MWQLIRPQAIAWRQWDDELVVYDDVTGSTHHLSSLGADVLLALVEHPAGITVTSLVAHVRHHMQPSAHGLLPAAIAGTLAELARLDLANSVQA